MARAGGCFGMSSIMARYMAEIVNSAATGGRPMPIDPAAIASGISRFATYAGSAFAVVLCVAKVVLYAVSIYYFRRPDVLALFSGQNAPQLRHRWARVLPHFKRLRTY